MTKFCNAPFHSIMVKFNGSVVPDSQFNGEFGNLYHNSIDEMWNMPVWQETRREFLTGRFPTQCNACELKENALGHSRRRFFVDLLDPVLQGTEKHYSPDIYFLEINTSNICNLKCLMCNGRTSTAWIKDEQALMETTSSRLRENIIKSKYRKHDTDTLLNNLFANKNNFNNLRYISLKGGEPFMDQTNYDLLKYIGSNYDVSNMTIDFTTNGTINTTAWWPLLKNFGKIKIHVSLEGTNDVYKFIRGGNYELLEILDNIKSWPKVNNLEVIWVFLLMAYNIFEVPNLIDLYNKTKEDHWRFNLKNIVINPNYLSPYIINIETRKDAAKQLVEYFQYESSHLYGIKHIHDALLKTQNVNEQTKKDFVDFTKDIINIRNNKELINGRLERILREVETSLTSFKAA